MTDFGTRLKQARKARGITQAQLAEGLGVTQSTIANYEANLRFPGEEALRDLADQLQVSIDHLMGLPLEPDLPMPLQQLASDELKALQDRFYSDMLSGREARSFDLVSRGGRVRQDLGGVFDEVVAPVLREVGLLWESGVLDVAQEHLISDSVDRLLSTLIQGIPEGEKPFTAVFLLPGAEEHHLSLRMAQACFKALGWRTVYLGRSLPVSSLQHFLENAPAQVLVTSVTLRDHLNSCEHLIRAIKAFPEAYRPRVLVGGRVIKDADQALRQLGADDYAASYRDLVQRVGALEAVLSKAGKP